MRPANPRPNPRSNGPQSVGGLPSDRQECLTVVSATSDDTTRLGEWIGRAVRPGDLILLRGPIGAGKTTFAQGLARGMGLNARVTSPSFTLANVYEGTEPSPSLFHLDLWRIRSAAEALGIGLDEYLGTSNICAIEWPEIAEDVLPREFLRVRFEVAGDARLLEFCPIGERPRALLASVRDSIGDPVVLSGGVGASGD
jgi:tRNA threonylcarbamoyladenosine biosynthesis protein TsaE